MSAARISARLPRSAVGNKVGGPALNIGRSAGIADIIAAASAALSAARAAVETNSDEYACAHQRPCGVGVPHVYGFSEAVGASRLQAAGFQARSIFVCSGSVSRGNVRQVLTDDRDGVIVDD